MSHLPIVLGVVATLLIFAGAVLTIQPDYGSSLSSYLLGAGVVTFLAGVVVFFCQEEAPFAEQ
ncbi:cell division protein FtsW (lipid II flippase) [Lewinella marina]|uniref:Uncharacterized protein n=1 Tax=Neolewinella marina TaxID=438751 RepID=A0A2G0CE09_9BACT|nr:hypothetical protein [Neolewinella marina]NJB87499.1 cell division protein FtsW (lipid II flippase) [Neolewinella marina]PHK98195.1 hypothetical protein CGL56_10840 [Neolewinella marina]